MNNKFTKWAGCLATILALTACSSEDVTDSNQLPDGKYPLQIASVSLTAESTAQPWGANAPQSRVSENTDGKSSKWNLDDIINVKLTGATETATFKVSNITAEAVTVTPTNTVYWTKTTDDVAAWYSTPAYTTGTTVNLANQTSANGLAYVLGTNKDNVSHANPISLDFSHQLAKVRVKLTGDKASEITAVKVKGYPSCSIDKTSGTVTNTGTETYLSTIESTYNGEKYWEANLVPQNISATDFVQLTDKKNVTHICSVSGVAKLDKAKYYVFNIEVKSAGPTTYPAGSPIPEITDDGEYIIEGNGNLTTNGIVINGSPSVTLKNVNISSKLGIEIKSGNPTIYIEGTCQLQSSKGSAIALTSENANVEIKGSGTNPTLTVTGDDYQAGIGGDVDDESFGNIKIENITLFANGASGAPGIGSCIPAGQGIQKKCGWIYIKNSTVTASGQYDSFFSATPAAIGNCSITGGASLEQGDITIENTSMTKSEILDKLTQLSGSHKIGNGTGGDLSRGTIKIGTIKIIAKDGTFTDNGVGYIDN